MSEIERILLLLPSAPASKSNKRSVQFFRQINYTKICWKKNQVDYSRGGSASLDRILLLLYLLFCEFDSVIVENIWSFIISTGCLLIRYILYTKSFQESLILKLHLHLDLPNCEKVLI